MPPRDPFAIFVWEVLSTHSTARKRQAALNGLKQIRALTPDTMWRAPQAKLEAAVGLAGPYVEQRLRALRTGVELFHRSPHLPAVIKGPVPAALKALKPLPQMGDGGAFRMLLFAGEHPVLPVDAALSRVARRLGYGDEGGDFRRTARSIRHALAAELPATSAMYGQGYLYLSHHGRSTCTETSPHCSICPLLGDCSHGQTRVGR
jgi:endonuclease-3